MNTRNVRLWAASVALATLVMPTIIRAQSTGNAAVVEGISKLEHDAVKADLASDKSFYEKLLTEDWIGGDSNGKFYSKADMLKAMSDPSKLKTNSESISDLKVRVYGRTAVATYKDTYDGMFEGQHRSRTVISTDTFVNMGGEWKQVSSHASTQSGS